jgi:hypothetical protein
MKHFILALSCIALLASCDNIDENNRYKDSGFTLPKKHVLLEDFTGQNCPNCPTAATIAAGLQAASGGNLIVVSIHAGGLSYKKFQTEEGTEYLNTFYQNGDETGYPAGMIDRTIIGGTRVSTEYSKWGTFIAERYNESPKISLDMTCSYDSVSRKVDIASMISKLTAVNSPLKLQLWLIESNIVSWQKVIQDNGSTLLKTNYVHNHVFRKAINGTWGESVNPVINAGTLVNNSFVLDTQYKAQNAQIVAFVYDANTYEVYQTAEADIVGK